MEKEEFVSTGWPLIKPFIMKAQGLQAPTEPEQQPGEIPLPEDHHQEESIPDGEEGEEEDEEHEEQEEMVKPSPVTPNSIEYDTETQALIEGILLIQSYYQRVSILPLSLYSCQ